MDTAYAIIHASGEFDPVSRQYIPEGAPSGDEQQQSNESNSSTQSSIGSPFGRNSPTELMKMLNQLMYILISIYSSTILAVILTGRTATQVFVWMLVVLYIWSLIADIARGIWYSNKESKNGWNNVWVMFIDFFSYVMILLFFQYASSLIQQEWQLLGFSVMEAIIYGVVFALYFMAGYYFLVTEYHDKMD